MKILAGLIAAASAQGPMKPEVTMGDMYDTSTSGYASYGMKYN